MSLFKTPKELIMSVIALVVVLSYAIAFILPPILAIFSVITPSIVESDEFKDIVLLVVGFYFGAKTMGVQVG